MKRDQIIDVFKELALSQGFYSRLLASINDADEDSREEFFAELEAQNFHDPVDLILYIEG